MEERKHPFKYTFKEWCTIVHSTTAKSRESIVGLISRQFSLRLSRILVLTPLTPNWITTISVFVYFAGMSLFFYGTLTMNLWACFLIFLSIVLDGCDGEIARFRQKASVLGGRYVEPVSHDIQYGLGFLLVAYLLFIQGGDPILLVMGALAGIFKLMARLLRFNWTNITKKEVTGDEAAAYAENYKKLPFVKRAYDWFEKNFFSSTSVLLIFLIGTLINHVDWVLWYYGIGFFVLWLMLFLKQIITIKRERII